MSRAEASRLSHDVWRSWEQRTHRPSTASLDAYYQFQLNTIRVVMDQVAIILDDQNVPPDIIEATLRGITYGAPNPAEAELRMAMMTDMTELRIKLGEMCVRPPDGL
jgi:hypothetical protein